jgi:L-threonylcarbamoyladenylate synthase
VSECFDVTGPDSHEDAVISATNSIRDGNLVVLPTDTVYGIGCDAFSPEAVERLLAAKGRDRQMPPPVLVSSAVTLEALGDRMSPWVLELTREYWPGPLTVVVHQQSSLQWDLGETRGTVAVRMPDHEFALGLLGRVGPMAVSSANVSGQAAATTIEQAREMLGEKVPVYLDAGPSAGELASTILDCTTDSPRILRRGALGFAELKHWLEEHGVDTERLVDDA